MYPTERTELLKHISVQWYNKKGESPYLFSVPDLKIGAIQFFIKIKYLPTNKV